MPPGGGDGSATKRDEVKGVGGAQSQRRDVAHHLNGSGERKPADMLARQWTDALCVRRCPRKARVLIRCAESGPGPSGVKHLPVGISEGAGWSRPGSCHISAAPPCLVPEAYRPTDGGVLVHPLPGAWGLTRPPGCLQVPSVKTQGGYLAHPALSIWLLG